MKGKRALAPLMWIAILIVGLFAVIAMFKLAGDVVPVFKEFVEKLVGIGSEKQKCITTPNHFWCEKASKLGKEYRPGCFEWGKRGVKGESCDPKSYKPVSYKQGEYDVCTEECIVDYCPAGTGRAGGKCVACRNEGEGCEGGLGPVGNAGYCCAPELMECKGILGPIPGKCEAKARVVKK